jgi:hypothetical protein
MSKSKLFSAHGATNSPSNATLAIVYQTAVAARNMGVGLFRMSVDCSSKGFAFLCVGRFCNNSYQSRFDLATHASARVSYTEIAGSATVFASRTDSQGESSQL